MLYRHISDVVRYAVKNTVYVGIEAVVFHNLLLHRLRNHPEITGNNLFRPVQHDS